MRSFFPVVDCWFVWSLAQSIDCPFVWPVDYSRHEPITMNRYLFFCSLDRPHWWKSSPHAFPRCPCSTSYQSSRYQLPWVSITIHWVYHSTRYIPLLFLLNSTKAGKENVAIRKRSWKASGKYPIWRHSRPTPSLSYPIRPPFTFCMVVLS